MRVAASHRRGTIAAAVKHRREGHSGGKHRHETIAAAVLAPPRRGYRSKIPVEFRCIPVAAVTDTAMKPFRVSEWGHLSPLTAASHRRGNGLAAVTHHGNGPAAVNHCRGNGLVAVKHCRELPL